MNFATLKQAITSVVSSPQSVATNTTALVGVSAAKASATINEWLQTAILLGTALSIFVKVVIDLRRRRHTRHKKKKTHPPSPTPQS